MKFSRQHRAMLLIGLIVFCNVFAFYSAVLAQPAAPPAAGAPVPIAVTPAPDSDFPTMQDGPIPDSPKPSPPPSTQSGNGGLDSLPAPGQPGSLANQAMQATNAIAPTTNLITQAAEQDKSWFDNSRMVLDYNQVGSNQADSGVITNALDWVLYNVIGAGWIPNLGWILAKYTQQFVRGWLGPAIGDFLVEKVVAFRSLPDVSFQTGDDFSPRVRDLAHLVRDFSYDLLLLFFIMAIWRYWNNAVWGKGSMWPVVGRLVAATAAVVAWPELYHYTILVANSASDLFVKNINPQAVGDAVVKYFFYAVSFQATAQSNTMIPFAWVIELLINIGIGLATFAALLAYFVEKAIQLTIVIMAYVFGPFFLVCMVSPDTESYASSFVRVFAEATVWNFIWGGLIQLMVWVILMGPEPGSPIYSIAQSTAGVTGDPGNPWFILLLVLGIMQAMLQVPTYLSRGHMGAKFGILELGFASYMAKRAVSAVWGTSGMYTGLRHALWDSQSHPWQVNLPKVPSLAKIDSNVDAGKNFSFNRNSKAPAVLPGTPLAGGSRMPLNSAATDPTLAPIDIGGIGGIGGVGGSGGGGGSYGAIAEAEQDGRKAPMRAPTNIDKMTGEQSPTARAASMMQRIRLFGDHSVVQDGKKANKNAQFTYDQLGGIDDIIMPKGASIEQKALTMAAASFANVVDERGNIDPGFQDVLWVDKVKASMRMGGSLNPLNPYGMYGQVQPTLLDRMALWLDDGKSSKAFRDVLAYRTESRWNNKMIARGITDYINNPGNEKTAIGQYWSARRGKFDAAQQIYRLTNPLARAGGVNTEWLESVGALARANVEGTRTTRTAASHPAVLRVATNQRPEYIHSMVRLLQESAATHFGEEATAPDGSVPTDSIINFYDGLIPQIGDEHVHAAAAITRNHGIHYVTPGNVDDVVKTKRQYYKTSLDRRHFDDAAKSIQMKANYHDFVGKLRV